jgi:hypothetical protein
MTLADWDCGVTGKGEPRWVVEGSLLRQTGAGTFPWCVRKGASLADGFVEVKFRPEAGKQDQAGGVMWRCKDGDNYYVARANALEDNVSLYYTTGGRRTTIKYVDAPVPRNQWHTLRVEFLNRKITVIFNGKPYIEVEDDRISGAGTVGVWTKADSVTSFQDFRYGP